jgi:predicted transcriptional regulator
MIPCEFMVNELLPTIRRQTTIFLASKNHSQKEIAQMLDITDAAVSQYLSKKRGKQVSRLEKEIKRYIQEKYDIKKSFSENVCDICMHIRKSNALCYYHKMVKKVDIKECNNCRLIIER